MPASRPQEDSDLSRLAGLKLGNYRLERLVGRGRMGVVYLAKDEALLRPTAIKLLCWRSADAQGHDPLRWFLAEARLVARINHPRVVQIYGAARQDQHCYIAMEYVVGRSAEAMINDGPVAPEVATDILLQAASALHAAHRSGVIHRDVKPANLLVGEGGVTKLGDFGMALGIAELSPAGAHARVGTPYYTAPEIWSGGSATPASDIYSLGATYYHLLTGRPPHPGRDVAAVEAGHLRLPVADPREAVPSLPASCADLLARALAKEPRRRQPSALVLLWEARRVMQDLVAQGATAGAAHRSPRPAASGATPSGAPEPGAPEPLAARPARAGPALPPAPRLLRERLGFCHRPFCEAAPPGAAHAVEPVASALSRALALLEDDATFALAVTGEAASGHRAVARRIAAELQPGRLVLAVDLDLPPERAGRTLLQRLCRAAAVAEEASEEATLDALVERLGEERARGAPTPLVLLEGVTAGAEAGRVVEAARWSGVFKAILAGAPGLPDALARGALDPAVERVGELVVPPLERDEIERYARGWLDATLAPGSPPVLFSRDALLLLSLRSGGALERVNCIAENMLLLAAAEGRRTVSSWHAWAAPDAERWADATAPALPRRPSPWPPPEVADVIDACRRGAGMPPWPRRAGRPA